MSWEFEAWCERDRIQETWGPQLCGHWGHKLPKTDVTLRFCKKVAAIHRHEAHRLKYYMSKWSCCNPNSPLKNEDEEDALIEKLIAIADYYDDRAEAREGKLYGKTL